MYATFGGHRMRLLEGTVCDFWRALPGWNRPGLDLIAVLSTVVTEQRSRALVRSKPSERVRDQPGRDSEL
jgi:hypothetical protein